MQPFNKLKVVDEIGGSNLLGYIDANIGMVTNIGTIVTTGDGGVITGGTGVDESEFSYYAYLTHITSGNAGHSFAWPTGNGSIDLANDTVSYNPYISGAYSQGTVVKLFDN